MTLPPELEQSLVMVADALVGAREPWWIIGSAAVALHGAAVSDVRDIDLLISVGDAERLLARLRLSPEPVSDHPQFRSTSFAVWRQPPLPVEIFAGFRLRTAEGWSLVQLQTREAIVLGGRTLFIPAAGELHKLLLSFGRPKDLERANSLAGNGF